MCLEPEARRIELAPAPASAMPIAAVLAVVTAVLGLWPEPLVEVSARLAGLADLARLPHFEAPWSTLVLVPYVGGFVVFAVGRVSPRLRDLVGVALALATLAMVAVDTTLDPTSKLFALIFTAIGAAMVVYSVDYMKKTEHADRYWFFAFLMIGSLIGLTTAHELGNFYVFWELMTWTSYFLVVHEQTPKALRAGLIYFVMCAGGAYVMHFGILLTHAQIGTFEFTEIAARIADVAPAVGLAIAGCFFVGFAVKAGLVPLHSWLPLAHPEAPVVDLRRRSRES